MSLQAKCLVLTLMLISGLVMSSDADASRVVGVNIPTSSSPAELFEIDIVKGLVTSVAPLPVAASGAVAMSNDCSHVYVVERNQVGPDGPDPAGGRVWILDRSSGGWSQSAEPTGQNFSRLAVDAVGRLVGMRRPLVSDPSSSSVFFIDPVSGSVTDAGAVLGAPRGGGDLDFLVRPDGSSRFFVAAGEGSNTLFEVALDLRAIPIGTDRTLPDAVSYNGLAVVGPELALVSSSDDVVRWLNLATGQTAGVVAAVPGINDLASCVGSIDLSVEARLAQLGPFYDGGPPARLVLDLENEGPSVATGVSVVARVSPEDAVEWDPHAAPMGCRVHEAALECELDSVLPGERLRFSAPVGVRRNATVEWEVMRAGQPDRDSVPGNGVVAEDDLALLSLEFLGADLSLELTGDKVGAVGDEVRAVVSVALDPSSPGPARGVSVDLRHDEGMLIRMAPEDCTEIFGGLRCPVGVLAPGDVHQLVLYLEGLEVGPREVVAEIATADLTDIDSTPGNGDRFEDDFGACPVEIVDAAAIPTLGVKGLVVFGIFMLVAFVMVRRSDSSRLFSAGLLMAAFLLGSGPAALAVHPDVIVVMADDVGLGDLGITGGTLGSPELEALAARGQILPLESDGPVCSPSRISFLLGQAPGEHGFFDGLRDGSVRGLPPGPTIASILQGYRRVHVGKGHVGLGEDHHFLQRGYDAFYGFRHAQMLSERGPTYVNPRLSLGEGPPIERLGHLTDLLFDFAISEVQRAREPLFMTVWPYAVHPPRVPAARWAVRFPDTSEGRHRALLSQLVERIIDLAAAMEASGRPGVLIFASDNGAGGEGSNAPLAGGKRELLQGGIQVPGFIVGFGIELPQVHRGPVLLRDLMATVAELADVSEGVPASSFSMFGPDPHRYIYREIGPKLGTGNREFSFRQGRYVFLFSSGIGKLYDLVEDPNQHNDLAASRPVLFAAIQELAWQTRFRESEIAKVSGDGGCREFGEDQGQPMVLADDHRLNPHDSDLSIVLRVAGMSVQSQRVPLVRKGASWKVWFDEEGSIAVRFGDARVTVPWSDGIETVVVSYRFPGESARHEEVGMLRVFVDGRLEGWASMVEPAPPTNKPVRVGGSRSRVVDGCFEALILGTELVKEDLPFLV